MNKTKACLAVVPESFPSHQGSYQWNQTWKLLLPLLFCAAAISRERLPVLHSDQHYTEMKWNQQRTISSALTTMLGPKNVGTIELETIINSTAFVVHYLFFIFFYYLTTFCSRFACLLWIHKFINTMFLWNLITRIKSELSAGWSSDICWHRQHMLHRLATAIISVIVAATWSWYLRESTPSSFNVKALIVLLLHL